MLLFYMKSVAILPHSLISAEKDVDARDLTPMGDYISDISLL
jgi:hypothetical protein